ncbi:MAG: cytidylate kinase [Gracilibacter sp. BRH_c7a]|nr:MAG: cytidylate kinase [Gracilibacter sp. BRH_c7a]
MSKNLRKNLQIAIDGPAGAGKSTVARMVAHELGMFYLDTGAMYRVISYKVLKNGILPEDELAVTRIAQETEITFDHRDRDVVLCDGEIVTSQIRSPEVNRTVSIVAAYAGVRERLVKIQRVEAAKGNVVMDGRDIGTFVLPEADIKIFLTASTEERAARRLQEIQATGINMTYQQVLDDIENRDSMDSQRQHSPLRPAEDAIIIDTTTLAVDEVAEKIVSLISSS